MDEMAEYEMGFFGRLVRAGAFGLRSARLAGVAVVALNLFVLPAPAHAETLNDALASAYQYNPRLDAERARLRATDEDVARAMSGFRPQITGQADVNSVTTKTRPPSITDGTIHPKRWRVDAVHSLFKGGQTLRAVEESDALVMAGQQTLRNVEQQILLDAVTSYMDVIRDAAIVRLRENNVTVLSKELKATQDRFAVGEVTKTDVAQAQARRAGSVSALDLARANLKSSRGNFERVVGHPPSNLTEPAAFEVGLPGSLEQAIGTSAQEHPNIIAAIFREQAARIAVDKIRGELLPEFQVEASYAERFDTNIFTEEVDTTTVTGRLNVPIYEGGESYARIRQAKHTHISRLQEIEQARADVQALVVTAWSQVQAAKAQLQSDTIQVSANSTALAGVREEERVGQRTLLDVLDAELELLNSQVQLVTTQRNLVVTSYSLRSTVGRLDALNLGVAAQVYDPAVHHEEVRRQWIGTSITGGLFDDWHTEVQTEPVK